MTANMSTLEIEGVGERTVGNTNHTSSNMMDYLIGGVRMVPVHENVAMVVNEGTMSDPTSFDNRVPLNMLPYKKDQITFELAGEVQRLVGRIRNRVMVGLDIEREEDGSETSPLTGGSGVQVRVKSSRMKIESYMSNMAVHH